MDGDWFIMAQLNENDTAGFYKYESEILTWGKWVLNLEYHLVADKHTEYELPIDGWYWFDSIQQARQFFNIPEPTTEEVAQTEVE
jgi:hypothetical protein